MPKETRTVWFHLCEVLGAHQFLETENKTKVTRSWVWKNGELLFNVSIWNNENVLKMNTGDDCMIFFFLLIGG